MVVEEAPSDQYAKERLGLTAQDEIDMAEVGKRQQLKVRTSQNQFIASYTDSYTEKLWLLVHAGLRMYLLEVQEVHRLTQ